jgi:hypothetical protein
MYLTITEHKNVDLKMAITGYIRMWAVLYWTRSSRTVLCVSKCLDTGGRHFDSSLVNFCIVIIRCTETFWTPCILLLDYLFLLTARFGRIVAFSCKISYCLTANYCKASIALRDKAIDTSLGNITIQLDSAVIVGKRNNVHSNCCAWPIQLVILGKHNGNPSILFY